MRKVFLHALKHSLKHTSTQGACFYARLLLQPAIENFTSFTATIRGGSPDESAGYQTADGVLHGHYWVQADPRALLQGESSETQAWVVDITADQLGAPPVLVMPPGEAACCYFPGNQSEVERHVREFGL